MPTWETLGAHRYYSQDDLLLFEIHGLFTLADTQGMFVLSERVEKKYGYTLTTFDARKVSGMAADARKYVGERSRKHRPVGATAIVGASFPIRALISLLQNATRLFGNPVPPTLFCATVEEALHWLAQHRPRFQANRPVALSVLSQPLEPCRDRGVAARTELLDMRLERRPAGEGAPPGGAEGPPAPRPGGFRARFAIRSGAEQGAEAQRQLGVGQRSQLGLEYATAGSATFSFCHSAMARLKAAVSSSSSSAIARRSGSREATGATTCAISRQKPARARDRRPDRPQRCPRSLAGPAAPPGRPSSSGACRPASDAAPLALPLPAAHSAVSATTATRGGSANRGAAAAAPLLPLVGADPTS